MNLVSSFRLLSPGPGVTLGNLPLLSERQFLHQPKGVIGLSSSKITGKENGLWSRSQDPSSATQELGDVVQVTESY